MKRMIHICLFYYARIWQAWVSPVGEVMFFYVYGGMKTRCPPSSISKHSGIFAFGGILSIANPPGHMTEGTKRGNRGSVSPYQNGHLEFPTAGAPSAVAEVGAAPRSSVFSPPVTVASNFLYRSMKEARVAASNRVVTFSIALRRSP